MSVVRKIAKNTLILTFAHIANSILSLILVVFIARFLGDIGFGKYSFALGFVALVGAIFSDFSITFLTLRDVAKDKSKASKYLGNGILIKLILSTFTFILIFISINLLNYPIETKIAVYLIGISFIFNNVALFFHSIFRAYEKMEYVALSSLIERLLSISLGILVLVYGKGLIGIAATLLFSGFCNMMFSFLVVAKKFTMPKLEIDQIFWKYLIKTGSSLFLIGVFYAVYSQSSIIILSSLKGDAPVGWYGAAYNLVFSLIFIPSAFMGAVFPLFSKFFETSKDSLKLVYQKSFEYLLIIGLPIAVGTTILAEKFVLFLYGNAFTNSIIALKILIWAIFFVFILSPMNNLLVAINREKIGVVVGATLALINVIFNLTLISSLSYVGASISMVITYLVGFILLFYFATKYGYYLQVPQAIFKPGIAVVIMSFFLIIASNIILIILVPLAGLLYFAVLIKIGGFSDLDLKLLRELRGKV